MRAGTRRWGGRSVWAVRGAVLALLVPVLVACGGDDGDDAGADPTPPATTASSRVLTPEGAGGDAAGAPAATPVASPEGTPGVPRTFGDLADRVNAAWDGVRSYRQVRVTTGAAGAAGTPGASPVADDAAVEITEEVVVPDRRRQVVRRGGEVASETVAIGGRVWVRGELARLAGSPPGEDGWVEIDPARFGAGTQLGALFAGLTAPLTPPFPDVPVSARTREVIPAGSVEVAGRACEAYRFAETTETGERVDITIALDPDDRLCAAETTVGQVRSRTEILAYDLDLSIEPPLPSVATPAASPAASPAAGA